jgi:Bacteriocin-protection, YdeI or OmpD-Associated/Domain of unknown function (DUF1905)
MKKFSAVLEIIDINPFVFVPDKVLARIFKVAGKEKGPIPISGTVNGNPYRQTLVKFRGAWRLYVNTTMLKDSPKRIGEIVKLTVEFDPADRAVKMHPRLSKALTANKAAKAKFNSLAPSRRHEIVRYISYLKTDESVDRNVLRIIKFLLGEGRFAGRDKP